MMNNLLELRGNFTPADNISGGGVRMPANKFVTSKTLKELKEDLIDLDIYWQKENLIEKALVSVYYNRVIPKSSRINVFFSKGSENSSQYIRGAKFDSNKNHIITYYIGKDVLKESISRIDLLINIIDDNFNGKVDSENFKEIEKLNFKKYNITKTKLQNQIIDMVDIVKFKVFENGESFHSEAGFITLFDTGDKIDEIMDKLGIKRHEYSRFSDDTIYVTKKSVLESIQKEASYLVSMANVDLAKYYLTTENKIKSEIINEEIPKPKNEPTIGVIDTLFDESVYFSKWVDSKNMLPDDIEPSRDDYKHGTAVCSLIVDGHRLNPKWDDGCGFFQVRHFGVARKGKNNSYDIILKIKKIVEDNPDIKVWNISLGSMLEIPEDYISPEASLLDELQYNNNCIFVVSGTNKDADQVRIGSPADSINSMVVNAVNKDNEIPSYARQGGVLSFFIKPDVAAFGGDKKEYVNVCEPASPFLCEGTSFAAPWISRKLAYLIEVMKLPREVAKALIIDSAIGWKSNLKDTKYLGYGIVPTRIEDIIYSKNDEIKFYIKGTATSYNTYHYGLPVPLVNDKFPFYAKAVMCYFPKCTRSAGVDYTNTELNLTIGRMKETRDKKPIIDPINKNLQDTENVKTTEAKAREVFRKWDNVKIAMEEIKEAKIPRKNFGTNFWGIRITNKDRLEREKGINFGLVVTLKEMEGKNRVREFVDQCRIKGWLVNEINIENRLDIYEEAEEVIEFK